MFLKTLHPSSFEHNHLNRTPLRCDTLSALTTLPVFVQSVRSVDLMCLPLNKKFHLKCQGKNFLSVKVSHLDTREFSEKLLALMPVRGLSWHLSANVFISTHQAKQNVSWYWGSEHQRALWSLSFPRTFLPKPYILSFLLVNCDILH